MADCVFDIETAALDEVDIPESLVQRLKDEARTDAEGASSRSGDPPRQEAWKEKLGLYAPTASVVCVVMLNPESRKGLALYDDRHGALDELDVPDGVEVTLHGGDEAELLERFWAAITRYDRVITYNGRRFDVPFVMQRSLVRRVTVSCDLMPPRYQRRSRHLDLADVLSQYGATRPFGLAAWTEATGAASPKEGAVSGSKVAEAFREGRMREIVEYCVRDVAATARLAARVLELWGPLI